MKVVMVNDCAFVGETLLKYMPPDIEKQHIKRSRGLWSKTFGLAYKILKAKGDVYHIHYLLQDCYIAARLGKKPLIGHVHGSDLRVSLKHPLWSRIVKHNLKKCDKVLVSTPDVLGIAKRFREDAEYLPNPVDAEIFYPKPLVEHDGKKRVLIASDSNWNVKGTDVAIRALGKIKEEVEVSIIRYGVDFEKTVSLAYSVGLHVNVLPKVPHEKLNQYYWNADVVIDRFKLGSLGVVSLEAIACGRPVITYVSSEYPEYNNFPLKDVVTENEIVKAIENADNDLWKKEYDYFKTGHTIDAILENLIKIYDSVRSC
ncbi:MAG: glycosyltransferase family 4 protein [Candidatus Bathyarchaeia archaeon]